MLPNPDPTFQAIPDLTLKKGTEKIDFSENFSAYIICKFLNLFLTFLMK